MAKLDSYVLLLRGINVGGKNMLPMKELAAHCAAAGASDVRTYINSGNVILRATPAAAAKLPAQVSKRILAAHGLSVPVVLRSHAELARVPAQNPFPGLDEKRLYVMFLADAPAAAAAAGLDPARSPGDEFRVVGREIFLSLTHAAKTKLTNAYFDTRLKTVSTSRNWRTLLTLIELSKPASPASE